MHVYIHIPEAHIQIETHKCIAYNSFCQWLRRRKRGCEGFEYPATESSIDCSKCCVCAWVLLHFCIGPMCASGLHCIAQCMRTEVYLTVNNYQPILLLYFSTRMAALVCLYIQFNYFNHRSYLKMLYHLIRKSTGFVKLFDCVYVQLMKYTIDLLKNVVRSQWKISHHSVSSIKA